MYKKYLVARRWRNSNLLESTETRKSHAMNRKVNGKNEKYRKLDDLLEICQYAMGRRAKGVLSDKSIIAVRC